MKVLIVEDEAPAFRRLEKILLEIDPTIEIVEVLDSVEDTVKWMNNHEHPDLALLDIQISDGISFQIFDQVEFKCPIIFTTAFDEYLLKAFKVNSIDYLLKPIKKEDLERSLEKYRNLQTNFSQNGVDMAALLNQINLSETKHKSRFLVKQGDKMLAIRSEDIVCFQSKHGVIHINTKNDKTYLSDFTLDELSNQLDPRVFFRANRQFIVSADYITSVHKYFKGKLMIEMDHFSDEQILVSSEKATSLKQWLDQ
ncbi:LytR/AlgR family response regulator transcription factor [Ekhidna sp. To15]|uniref:LytR/AlgR family response regulator transcription factor n=1 Tax=Ekhidna sp. To15 TaxID=3395267 RepID=UPI003F526852